MQAGSGAQNADSVFDLVTTEIYTVSPLAVRIPLQAVIDGAPDNTTTVNAGMGSYSVATEMTLPAVRTLPSSREYNDFIAVSDSKRGIRNTHSGRPLELARAEVQP